MNQFKRLLLIFVSISGLISCSSDKSAQPTTGSPRGIEKQTLESSIKNIQISQKDRSYKILDPNLDEIDISSSFKFDYKNESFAGGEIHSTTICSSPQRQENLIYETRFNFSKEKFEFPVHAFLPPEALAPIEGEAKVTCTFEIDLIEADEISAKIEISNAVSILNTNNFSNLNIIPDASYFQVDPNYIFRLTDLKSFQAELEELSHVYTVCSNQASDRVISESANTLESFFASDLFEETPVTSCRIVSVDEETFSTKVSQIINVEGRWSDLKIETELRLEHTHEPFKTGGYVALLYIENKGNAKASLSFSTSSGPAMQMQPFYGNPLPHGKIGIFPNWKIHGQWYLINHDKPLSENETFEIAPGEALSIGLKAQSGIRCPINGPRFAGGAPGYQPTCHDPQYLGSNFKISIPSLFYKTRKNREREDWASLKWDLGGSKAQGTVTLWLPNKNLPKQCGNLPVVTRPPNHQGSRWFDYVSNCSIIK